MNLERRIEFRCNNCGSGDVRSDAWAEWDIEKQEWALDNMFDDMYCVDCEGECSCTDVDLDSEREIRDFLHEFDGERVADLQARLEQLEAENGPDGDDGRDFSPPYEP